MTWGEIQKQTLRKLFAKDEEITTKTIAELKMDDDCKLYLDGMAGVANEALQRVKTYAGIEPIMIDSNYSEDENLKRKTMEDENNKEEEITDDVCVLLPLYMASQLYKDDDISIATTYRNEFELGLEELVINIEIPQIESVYY